MVVSGHQFFLVLRSETGLLHEEELDFSALIHDIAFAGVTAGRLANDGRWEPVAIEPEWKGETFEGVTVSVAGLSRAYGRTAFHDRAVEILCTKGVLREEDPHEQARVSWNVERRKPNTPPSNGRTRASVRHRPYPLVPQALEGDAKREAGNDDSISMRVSSDFARRTLRGFGKVLWIESGPISWWVVSFRNQTVELRWCFRVEFRLAPTQEARWFTFLFRLRHFRLLNGNWNVEAVTTAFWVGITITPHPADTSA